MIAVTGATGRLGGRIARRLADAGVAQRLLVRDVRRAPVLPGATPVVAPYGDGAAVRRALRGIDTVLMISATESEDRLQQHLSFVAAARAAGVAHIVYTSFFGAGPEATFRLARTHWQTEQALRGAGPAWTFLRDCLYADFLPGLVEDESTGGVIRGPAGSGRVAAVAQDDIADVATAVLLRPAAHAGRTYDLTGPEALGLADIARILSAAQGRPIRYQEEDVQQAYASRSRYGAPDWQVEAWVSTYEAIANGEMGPPSGDVAAVLGRPAVPVAALFPHR
ncbi:SDR family oxidoreductase [Raineyella sp. W15-4]|uniref:SDR family oxidoreductase n=1 Tax=Raineyella sp. W15-4 TaxID=3081651 RepID=UPI0029552FFC|nr:SDR family oxidoreductase [Raineyella sp. W15-4]WOQ17521.1 SDR family oxidoreductase [Raineyella sp. W15-4]